MNTKFEYNHGVIPTLTAFYPGFKSREKSNDHEIDRLLYIEEKRNTLRRERENYHTDRIQPFKRPRIDPEQIHNEPPNHQKNTSDHNHKKRK